MKVARFSRIRPQFDVTSMFGGGTAGGPAGQVPTSNGSNVSWGSNVATIWANGSNQIMGPAVNFAAGSNIEFTFDGAVGSQASNTIRIHSTGGGGSVSYGSNSNSVGTANAAGASTLVSRADHVHQGVRQLTSNSSNARVGDVNLVAGSGIALGVSSQDITITNTGQGSGGGGGSGTTKTAAAVARWHIFPFASTNSAALTITAATAGQRIVLAVATRGADVTGVSCTNVTFTEVQGVAQSTSTFLSIYVGVVAGGSSGTTITITVGGTNFVFATAVIVDDALTPTVVNSASLTAASVSTIRKSVLGPVSCSIGDFLIMAYATNDASNAVSSFECSSPLFWIPDDSLCGLHLAIGRAGATKVSGWFDGGNSAVAVGLVAVT